MNMQIVKDKRNTIWILSLFAVAFMIIDLVIGNVGNEDFVNDFYKSLEGHLTFYSICIALITIQLILAIKIFNKFNIFFLKTAFYSRFKLINIAFTVVISSSIIGILFEVIFNNQYHTDLLTFITFLSYIQVIFYMSFLSIKYFRWLRMNPTINIVFYFLWTLAIAVSFTFQLVLNEYVLINKPDLIAGTSVTEWPNFDDGRVENIIGTQLYLTSDLISYSLLWISITYLVDGLF